MKIFMNIRPTHPRLLCGDEGFAPLLRNAETPLAERILRDAEKLLAKPPQARKMEGRRLLGASRTVLYRLTHLATARILTGDRRFSERAAREMLNAARFSDWNPSHFLDTAELALALALGCDWLWDDLDPADREEILNALTEKGLRASFEHSGWVKNHNNWNAVCHTGMIAAAVTVFEREPELALRTLRRAVKYLPVAMKPSYAPRGAYPEGPMYWGYGTDFLATGLAMLESACGSDFGLSNQPGFAETAEYYRLSTAPSGEWFCYADCSRRPYPSFAAAWLARKFHRPEWFGANERRLARSFTAPGDLHDSGLRLTPLILLFLPEAAPEKSGVSAFFSGGRAEVPISIHRSDPTRNAAWLGVKGGSPSGPHGHMDAGSFVFESMGRRWAYDLGYEKYGPIEALGLKLWNPGPEGDRWRIFRLGPESHNILRLGGRPQRVEGVAKFLRFSPTAAKLDLSSLYTAKRVTRSFKLLPERGLEVRDAVAGAAPGLEYRWQMCTAAEVLAEEENGLLLADRGKHLRLTASMPGTWSVIGEEALRQPYDSPNPGMKIVRFTAKIPAEGKLELAIRLMPV